MNYENYFEDMFESSADYRKIVLIILIQNDKDLSKECGFLKNDSNRLNKEFKTTSKEQNEEYLDHIKNEEEPVI